jgi:tRNA nucleotidyltransferase (CCA-adding enzyme)
MKRTLKPPPFPVEPRVEAIARQLAEAGGRALLVGGFVRDYLLGLETKDYDFEVFGLPLVELETALATFGEVIAVGRAFGVLKIKGFEGDFAIPRRDSKVGRGHRGFVVDLDPDLDFATAARRRDLTINSMAYDPLSGEILDPHGGRGDLERGVLRATDPEKFGEDSLRALRVAQFLARFAMAADEELFRLCAATDLADLPGERLWGEVSKLLLKARRPSLGLEFLRQTGLLRFFPELAAMVGVPQDPEWHPEGTVWEHTLMVVDEAAALRTGEREADLVLMFGALCHDLGKPATTVVEGGRVRSPDHESQGLAPTRAFLHRLRANHDLVDQVCALVANHLAPAQFTQGGATLKAYRRLARKLDAVGLPVDLFYRVTRADHLGRTTPDALAREYPAGDLFLEKMAAVGEERHAVRDVVQGRHLIGRGFAPGPAFGPVLDACRDLQDETGSDDPEWILGQVLAHFAVDLSPISS